MGHICLVLLQNPTERGREFCEGLKPSRQWDCWAGEQAEGVARGKLGEGEGRTGVAVRWRSSNLGSRGEAPKAPGPMEQGRRPGAGRTVLTAILQRRLCPDEKTTALPLQSWLRGKPQSR